MLKYTVTFKKTGLVYAFGYINKIDQGTLQLSRKIYRKVAI